MEPPLVYNTSAEYRALFRRAFSMNLGDFAELCAQYGVTEDDADGVEVIDEIYYDAEPVKAGMAVLFANTADDPLFAEIYLLAAATMLSQDPHTGQCVTFSYSYWAQYHECLRDFFCGTAPWTPQNPNYLALKSALTPERARH